jgi:hypothetical protein
MSITTDTTPIAVTVHRACEVSGLGPTTIWAYLKQGLLEPVRPPGIRRTLVSYASLARLLAPQPGSDSPRRRRGRPRKHTHGRASGEAT